MKDITLTAALSDSDIWCSTTARTISGTVVQYGTVGNTSAGPTTFVAGSLQIPEDHGRVKLLDMHDQERPLGHMAAAIDDTDKLYGSYRIATGEAGDAAIQGIKERTRDALSLGASVQESYVDDDGVLVVTKATLLETSLVTIPAFEDSRVESLAAQRKETTVNTENTENTTPPAVETPAPVTAASAANLVQAAATPPTETPEQIHAGRVGGEDLDLDALALKVAAAGRQGADASAINTTVLAKTNPKMLTAALTDVVPADDAGLASDVTRPKWIGELWQARRTERPTIDSLNKQRLTALKMYGYRLVYPTAAPDLINEYAGGKAPVPASGKVTTAPAEATATRYAGGWDVDRAFFDFNDGGFVRATLQAAYDEYLRKTEASVVEAMLAAATAVTAADVVSILAAIGQRAAELGSSITKIQFAPDLWADFVNLKTADVPWWLQKQGAVNLGTTEGNAGGLSFNVNPNIPAGQILAHDRRAATFFEVPLINVQAQNIPDGGIDLGVFGYTAEIINDARAIFKGSVTPAP